MSKLFARAKVKYENAEDNYLKIDQDDAFLDETCHCLQQTIEFALKYIVEMNGENYVETHDVLSHLNTIRNLGVDLPMLEDIRAMASTINSWESEPLYNDDFTASLADVETVRIIASGLITYCGHLVTEL